MILLVERARAPFFGYYSLPGGGVELGETVEEALVREVREETGYEVRVLRFLGYADAIDHDSSGQIQRHYVILYFEAEVTGGIETSADDAAATRWMTVTEARQSRITDSVDRCLRWVGL